MEVADLLAWQQTAWACHRVGAGLGNQEAGPGQADGQLEDTPSVAQIAEEQKVARSAAASSQEMARQRHARVRRDQAVHG